MPHVILEGPLDLQQFCATYKPVVKQHDGEILKLLQAYLSTRGDEALIEAIAIQNGYPVRFLVQILSRNNRTTVKLYPGTDPEKTNGVKKIIGIVARQLKACSSGVQYGANNLGEFLLE